MSQLLRSGFYPRSTVTVADGIGPWLFLDRHILGMGIELDASGAGNSGYVEATCASPEEIEAGVEKFATWKNGTITNDVSQDTVWGATAIRARCLLGTVTVRGSGKCAAQAASG